MRRQISFAILAGALAFGHPAVARAAGAPVPTPGPQGTPVTFGSPAPIGAPVPITPLKPDDVMVPTTNPEPNHEPLSFVRRHEVFVVGDYLIQPTVYNEFSPGYRTGKASYGIRGATEFNLGILPVMLEGESRNQAYDHVSSTMNPVLCNAGPGIGNAGCVTRIGSGNGSGYVTPFVARDTDIDGRLGVKLLDPRIYIAAAYLWKSNNYGYGIQSGYGLGLEKLPDFEGPIGVYFGLYYFPNVTGQYRGLHDVTSEGLKYRIFRYEGGVTVVPHGSPVFIEVGIEGDRESKRAGSPASETHLEPYAGVGIRVPH